MAIPLGAAMADIPMHGPCSVALDYSLWGIAGNFGFLLGFVLACAVVTPF